MDNSVHIKISGKAGAYLKKKVDYFLSRARVPRIVLAKRSCSGANFRLFFEPVQNKDHKVELDGLKIWIPHDLLEEFGGFRLDLETFFFARRLKISPLRQSYKCDCNEKCSVAAR